MVFNSKTAGKKSASEHMQREKERGLCLTWGVGWKRVVIRGGQQRNTNLQEKKYIFKAPKGYL